MESTRNCYPRVIAHKRGKTGAPYSPGEKSNGGEGGIRTHEALAGPHALQACALVHSATSPRSAGGSLRRLSRRRKLAAQASYARCPVTWRAASPPGATDPVAAGRPPTGGLLPWGLTNRPPSLEVRAAPAGAPLGQPLPSGVPPPACGVGPAPAHRPPAPAGTCPALPSLQPRPETSHPTQATRLPHCLRLGRTAGLILTLASSPASTGPTRPHLASEGRAAGPRLPGRRERSGLPPTGVRTWRYCLLARAATRVLPTRGPGPHPGGRGAHFAWRRAARWAAAQALGAPGGQADVRPGREAGAPAWWRLARFSRPREPTPRRLRLQAASALG
jgi:hypothetical protein